MLRSLLRTPTTNAHWDDATNDDAARSILACWRIGRDLDREDVRVELRAWLVGDDPTRARAAVRILGSSEESPSSELLASAATLLEHPAPEVAREAALAFLLRVRRGHPLGVVLAQVVAAQRRAEIRDSCAFAVGVSTKRRLPEPSLEAALPAAIATLDIRWESAELLERAFDEGVFLLQRTDLDGPVGALSGARERGRLSARMWQVAIDRGLVEREVLTARLLHEASSKNASDAREVVTMLGHLRAVGFAPAPFVDVLEALLAHGKSTVVAAARNLLQTWSRGALGEELFEAAERMGFTRVAALRSSPPSADTPPSVAELVASLATLPKGRSLEDQAARQKAEEALATALALAMVASTTREEAEQAVHTLARTKSGGELAGRVFAAAWLDGEEDRLASLLQDAAAPLVEGVFIGITHWTEANRDREIKATLFDVLRALHVTSTDRVRRAAWRARFRGVSALRESLLRSGEASVLALVGWGEERGADLSVASLKAQLSECPSSFDVCLPAVAYAMHGQPRHELLMTVSTLLERGAVPPGVAQQLVPLVFGVLLNRDFASPITDRRACQVLAQSFEAGAEPRGTLPLLGSRLAELEAVVALRAGLRHEPRLTRGLEEGCVRELERPLVAPPRAEELERRYLLASILAEEAT